MMLRWEDGGGLPAHRIGTTCRSRRQLDRRHA